MTEIKDYIRTIPDVPQQGVMFRDVTPLLSDPTGLRLTIDQMVQCYAGRPIDKVIGIDERGFLRKLYPKVTIRLTRNFRDGREKPEKHRPDFIQRNPRRVKFLLHPRLARLVASSISTSLN